jgi:GT2 family glycosyltransferase
MSEACPVDRENGEADPAAAAAPASEPSQRRTVSVIIATYNRADLLVRLLRQLGTQDFPVAEMEVVVVDDGSKEPAAGRLEPLKAELPYPLQVITQANAGAAAARQRAATSASGEILVILDDDMQVRPDFIAEHVRLHREGPGRTCVMGRYASDPDIASMPLFERYYANMWDKLSESIRAGKTLVTGTLLSTGNASMRREDFLAVGGFDMTLKQGEDSELGLKLERAGVHMVFSERAYTLHGSDHTRLERWLVRNYGYGVCDSRIGRMHEWAAHADPWRYVFSLPRLGLPFVTASVVAPGVAKHMAMGILRVALLVERAGLEKVALRGAGVVFGMEYFRGVRDESGSLGNALASFARFLGKAASAPTELPGIPKIVRVARAWMR